MILFCERYLGRVNVVLNIVLNPIPMLADIPLSIPQYLKQIIQVLELCQVGIVLQGGIHFFVLVDGTFKP
jgi:hypothetical protein